jgi:hypothetical protein
MRLGGWTYPIPNSFTSFETTATYCRATGTGNSRGMEPWSVQIDYGNRSMAVGDTYRTICMSIRTLDRMERYMPWVGLRYANFRTRAMQGIRDHVARLVCVFKSINVRRYEDRYICEEKCVNNTRNSWCVLVEDTKGILNDFIAAHSVFLRSGVKVTVLYRYWSWESKQDFSTDGSRITTWSK